MKLKLKSFREWAKVHLIREDETAGDPQDLLQRAQVSLGKVQDDEVKGLLNDVISYLQGQVGGDQDQGGDSDQATDGADNLAGAGGTGGGQSATGMQGPVGGGMQNATM